MVDLNLKGPFRLSALVGERMVADGGGSIINVALQRLGEPPEIVGAALYLASDASRYTSGSIIRVDGGIP